MFECIFNRDKIAVLNNSAFVQLFPIIYKICVDSVFTKINTDTVLNTAHAEN